VSPRLLRVLVPLLVLLTAGFALFQLFLFGIALRVRDWPMAGMYLVMGIAGVAIASSLWRTARRRLP
jgi:hypothetical protein